MGLCPCADRYAVFVSYEKCSGCGQSGRLCASCLSAHEETCLKQQNDLLLKQLKHLLEQSTDCRHDEFKDGCSYCIGKHVLESFSKLP